MPGLYTVYAINDMPANDKGVKVYQIPSSSGR